MEIFLSDRYQCIVLNGQASSWAYIKAIDAYEAKIIRNNLTPDNNLASLLFKAFCLSILSKLLCNFVHRRYKDQPCQSADSFLLEKCTLGKEVAVASFCKTTQHLMALVDASS